MLACCSQYEIGQAFSQECPCHIAVSRRPHAKQIDECEQLAEVGMFVEQFAAHTTMALLGVSHAASEFLVMQSPMQQWFTDRYALSTVLLPESHWWR